MQSIEDEKDTAASSPGLMTVLILEFLRGGGGEVEKACREVRLSTPFLFSAVRVDDGRQLRGRGGISRANVGSDDARRTEPS